MKIYAGYVTLMQERRGQNENPLIIHHLGELSRSLYDRVKEHWRGFSTKSENSHIYKHHQLHHGGEEEPSFLLRPIEFFTTAGLAGSPLERSTKTRRLQGTENIVVIHNTEEEIVSRNGRGRD